MTTKLRAIRGNRVGPFRWRRALWVMGILLAVYAIGLEPQWLDVTQHEITLRRLPPALNGLRIVQLTDFHFPVGLPVSYYRRVVAQANAQHADLIVLTGDFIARAGSDAEPCARELAGLHAPLGVWAIMGNHDYWTDGDRMRHSLEQVGIPVLINRAVPIATRGARLWLVGVDDVWSGHPQLDVALRGVPEQEAKIVLVHEPDYADTVMHYPVDLQLSGHSHGGQVRLPFIGSLFLPKYGRKYPIGLQHAGGLPVFTSRGIGGVSIPVLHWPIRFCCRPEVSVLTLRSL